MYAAFVSDEGFITNVVLPECQTLKSSVQPRLMRAYQNPVELLQYQN